MMALSLLPTTKLGTFVAGAVAAVVGPIILRPIIVGIVRAGYEVKDYADGAWKDAKSEAKAIKRDATAR